jgi:hypothetical protein
VDREALEALFYKIDTEGLEYTLDNYFDLFEAIPYLVEPAGIVIAKLRWLWAELEKVRVANGIEES